MKKKNFICYFMVTIFFIFCFSLTFTTQVYAQTIKDGGEYIIFNKRATEKCMDVSDVSYSNSANVHIWDNFQNDNQQWILKRKGGYYTIIAKHSRKALDVAGGIAKKGTNVQQYEQNSTDAQKWELKPAGDGYFYIKSKLGNYVLDVQNGWTGNGTNIRIWEPNQTDAQKWKIVPVQKLKFSSSYAYTINSRLSGNKVLDVEDGELSIENQANVHLWDNVGNENQKWLVYSAGNNHYRMIAYHSGKALDVSEARNRSGTNVQQYTSNLTSAQSWKFIQSEEEGYYYIKPECSDCVLDVAYANTNNGANIQIHSKNYSNAQKWKIKQDIKINPNYLALDCDGNFCDIKISQKLRETALDKIKDVVSSRNAVSEVLNSIQKVDDIKWVSEAPSIPRRVMEEFKKNKSARKLGCAWSSGGVKYIAVLNDFYNNTYNVYIIREDGGSVHVIMGIFVNRVSYT